MLNEFIAIIKKTVSVYATSYTQNGGVAFLCHIEHSKAEWRNLDFCYLDHDKIASNAFIIHCLSFLRHISVFVVDYELFDVEGMFALLFASEDKCICFFGYFGVYQSQGLGNEFVLRAISDYFRHTACLVDDIECAAEFEYLRCALYYTLEVADAFVSRERNLRTFSFFAAVGGEVRRIADYYLHAFFAKCGGRVGDIFVEYRNFVLQIIELDVLDGEVGYFFLKFNSYDLFARRLCGKQQRNYAVAATEIHNRIASVASHGVGKKHGVGSEAISVGILQDFKSVALQIVKSQIAHTMILQYIYDISQNKIVICIYKMQKIG